VGTPVPTLPYAHEGKPVGLPFLFAHAYIDYACLMQRPAAVAYANYPIGHYTYLLNLIAA
jgi:hypothetical protein